MNNHLHNELRKEFQLERLILFSDAVFAIAITLLVIEIKIPEVHNQQELTDSYLLLQLKVLIPKFVGFLISFLLIGQYWRVHHRMFGFIIDFNERLIWLNILFLLSIALMPFSTGFYSEYAGRPVVTPVIFYTCNIAILGIINFIMWQYISKPQRGLTENLSPQLANYCSLRAVTVPVVFIICSIVYVHNPAVAGFIPLSIPLIMRFVFSPMRRKIINQKNKIDL